MEKTDRMPIQKYYNGKSYTWSGNVALYFDSGLVVLGSTFGYDPIPHDKITILSQLVLFESIVYILTCTRGTIYILCLIMKNSNWSSKMALLFFKVK